jgi:cell division protein FtsL
MEIKVNLGQIIILIIQIVGYACTIAGIAYVVGKKITKIELRVEQSLEKWDDLADEVKTLSNRMWDERTRPRGRT